MTTDKFETRIITKDGTIHFEEYMVKRGAKDEVLGVEFFGAEKAKPAPGVIEAIENAERVDYLSKQPSCQHWNDSVGERDKGCFETRHVQEKLVSAQ